MALAVKRDRELVDAIGHELGSDAVEKLGTAQVTSR
jgi:hypothetical protein